MVKNKFDVKLTTGDIISECMVYCLWRNDIPYICNYAELDGRKILVSINYDKNGNTFYEEIFHK